MIEVKTTDVYAVKTATLLGYINELISAKQISDGDHALGLYVIGRPDPEIKQLENAIIAEKKTAQLRIISVESLLSLAELMTQFDVSHNDILDVLMPSGPNIDSLVDLMSRLVAQRSTPAAEVEDMQQDKPPLLEDQPPITRDVTRYWLTPVKSTDLETAEECIRKLLGREQIYGFGDRTPGRKGLKSGDWICFYATATGIVAHAKVVSAPKREPHPAIIESESYPWTFRLSDIDLYLENPVVVDAALRSGLEAFSEKDPSAPWAWFVQATHTVTRSDFKTLTREMAL